MLKKIILLTALIVLTVTAQSEAAESDLPFDIIATTYVDGGPKEMVALVKMKSDGSPFFLTTAEDLEVSALIPFVPEVYNFYLRKDQNDVLPPLIFMMFLFNEQRGQAGEDLGEWNDDVHIMPVYALFTVENEQVVCQKPFKSAKSMDATQFEVEVQNPVHTRLTEILMTHMPRLHQVIKEQNITLQ